LGRESVWGKKEIFVSSKAKAQTLGTKMSERSRRSKAQGKKKRGS
jgi:hypothetical protein